MACVALTAATAQDQVLTDLLGDQELDLLLQQPKPFQMMPMKVVQESCATNSNMCPRGSRALWGAHNFMMWLMWVVFMGIVLSSARYFRHYWRKSIYIHATFGIIVLITTLTGASMAWARNYQISFGMYIMHWRKYSAMFENIATFYAMAISISGIIAWFTRRYGTYEWGTTFVLKLGKFHKYISLVFCFFAQGLIMFAIMDNFAFQPTWIAVAACQYLTLAFIIGIFEYKFRKTWFEEVPFVLPAQVMTVEEFEKCLEKGAKYMILDDLILDVSEFYRVHPGGKFVIEHCVGTDIAKFFYGGYCLEDNMKPTPSFGFKHSNYARMIANDLAVARLDCQQAGSVVSRCRLRWDKDNIVNKLTRSFFLETMDKEPRLNYKSYFPGMKYLTRHFWIRNMNNSQVIRHYTTCNAMATDFYNELVRVLKDPSQVQSFKKSLLNTADGNTMTFTVKNYKKSGGMSYRFFETDQRAEYEIKGPMGKGLAPESKGIHLAFAAGTGNLCFVDMVAHIALAELGLLTDEDNLNGRIDTNGFQMHLYASFPSKADAVAYELCESLDTYCKNKGSKSFELHPRLSKEKINTARWNEAWIEKTLTSYPAAEVQRMWVCGPPVMNETFDRTLGDMTRRLPSSQLIRHHRIELL